MRYKIILTTPEKKTAEQVSKLIQESKIYNSKNILSLSLIKEVCDECASK